MVIKTPLANTEQGKERDGDSDNNSKKRAAGVIDGEGRHPEVGTCRLRNKLHSSEVKVHQVALRLRAR